MTKYQWSLIILLAIFAYGIRFVGLIAGNWIYRQPRLEKVLDDLPGCLVIALVAASLSHAEAAAWIAAAIALAVAGMRGNVIVVMIVGAGAYAWLQAALG